MQPAAITGVGYTALSHASGTSVLELARSACAAAIEDAGLDRSEIDGVASFMLNDDSVPCLAVATARQGTESSRRRSRSPSSASCST